MKLHTTHIEDCLEFDDIISDTLYTIENFVKTNSYTFDIKYEDIRQVNDLCRNVIYSLEKNPGCSRQTGHIHNNLISKRP